MCMQWFSAVNGPPGYSRKPMSSSLSRSLKASEASSLSCSGHANVILEATQ